MQGFQGKWYTELWDVAGTQEVIVIFESKDGTKISFLLKALKHIITEIDKNLGEKGMMNYQSDKFQN